MTMTTVADEESLDQMLLDLNEAGTAPVVVGFNRLGQPFLAYGSAPGGDGWWAGFVTDDPYSYEYDFAAPRCPECNSERARSIEELSYPVQIAVVSGA